MVQSKSIDEISHEIADNLKENVFEVITDECNMDVVEYYLIEEELARFSYYDRYFWSEFRKAIPENEGYYWLTVITKDGERKVVLAKWYNRSSFRYWANKFKVLLAWKPCILPEPYKED